jgi:hypothetical protein
MLVLHSDPQRVFVILGEDEVGVDKTEATREAILLSVFFKDRWPLLAIGFGGLGVVCWEL